MTPSPLRFTRKKVAQKSLLLQSCGRCFQRLASQMWALSHLHEKCKSNTKYENMKMGKINEKEF
jgi:hypothetical protein